MMRDQARLRIERGASALRLAPLRLAGRGRRRGRGKGERGRVARCRARRGERRAGVVAVNDGVTIEEGSNNANPNYITPAMLSASFTPV